MELQEGKQYSIKQYYKKEEEKASISKIDGVKYFKLNNGGYIDCNQVETIHNS